MARRCQLTGKSPLTGYTVSHAHNKTKRRQLPNLQSKRIWVPELGRFVRLTLSTRAIRSLTKMGLPEYCRKRGLDMNAMLK
jgi:large subunit ribosomal protein L28